MKTTFYLVRHGEAAGNKERFYQGHTDGAVTEKGRIQIAAVAERLRPVHFDAIYSSHLVRAMETAQAICEGRNLAIEPDDRLIELNGGVWEGKKWSAMPELFPEDARHWSLEPHLFHPEGGESAAEVRERMSAALMELARRHPGQTVCVVSHGCAIRCMLTWAKGWPLERLNDVGWGDNTAISVVEVENGVPTLILESDSSHLTDEISTLAGQNWWRDRTKMVYDD